MNVSTILAGIAVVKKIWEESHGIAEWYIEMRRRWRNARVERVRDDGAPGGVAGGEGKGGGHPPGGGQ